MHHGGQAESRAAATAARRPFLALQRSSSIAKQNLGCRVASASAVGFKGVRMRVWGKWVTEIRDPVTKTRIWLGSFATAEMAARAYDAAVVCLKGASAPEVNFPDSIPSFVTSQDYSSPKEIQSVALAAATASVPAEAPRAMAAAEMTNPRSECEALVEVTDCEFHCDDDGDENGDLGNADCDVSEPDCSSGNVENWINKEFDFDDLEAAEVVDPWRELSEFVEPPFPPWLMTSTDFEDAEDGPTRHHDMRLWSFA